MNALAVLEHELVGIDTFGRRCACGRPFTLEHLGEVALVALNAPESLTVARDEQKRLAKLESSKARVAARMAVTRRVLLAQAAESERLGRRLDATGLTDLTDRAAWLNSHRRYPRRYNAAGERIDTMYDYDDPDTAPGGHDERAEEEARILFEQRDADAAFPVDDHSRHVLIIEPSGWSYIAPHLDLGRHPFSECKRVGDALTAFRERSVFDAEMHSTIAVEPFSGVEPGRFWCSVDADGNFEIGSRIIDEFSPAPEPVDIEIPDSLCGVDGCVFMAGHMAGQSSVAHSWEV